MSDRGPDGSAINLRTETCANLAGRLQPNRCIDVRVDRNTGIPPSAMKAWPQHQPIGSKMQPSDHMFVNRVHADVCSRISTSNRPLKMEVVAEASVFTEEQFGTPMVALIYSWGVSVPHQLCFQTKRTAQTWQLLVELQAGSSSELSSAPAKTPAAAATAHWWRPCWREGCSKASSRCLQLQQVLFVKREARKRVRDIFSYVENIVDSHQLGLSWAVL